MQVTIKDEHRPGPQSFQIVGDNFILARGVSREFAMWIIRAAEALAEIGANQGTTIYGTPELRHAPDGEKEAFRLGAGKAFDRDAATARAVEFGRQFTDREIRFDIPGVSPFAEEKKLATS